MKLPYANWHRRLESCIGHNSFSQGAVVIVRTVCLINTNSSVVRANVLQVGGCRFNPASPILYSWPLWHVGPKCN